MYALMLWAILMAWASGGMAQTPRLARDPMARIDVMVDVTQQPISVITAHSAWYGYVVTLADKVKNSDRLIAEHEARIRSQASSIHDIRIESPDGRILTIDLTDTGVKISGDLPVKEAGRIFRLVVGGGNP